MSEDVFRSPKKRGKIAVFLSGRGSNFVAIHDAIQAGTINADIDLVFSNKKDAPGLKIAEERSLNTLSLNPKEFSSREDYDRKIVEEIQKRDIDLICLAGYMRILSPQFVKRFKNKIINIHPAILPAFKGTHSIERAFSYGCKVTGVTVHFIDEQVDHGPIILQERVEVKKSMTLAELEAKIHRLEHKLYPLAIKLFLTNRLKITNRRVAIV